MLQHGLSKNGELIILQRFHGGVRTVAARPGAEVSRLLFVDVETTGLQPGRDPVIEFAAAEVDVDVGDGSVAAHHRTVSWLEDPGRPIPAEVVALTGLDVRDPARAAEQLHAYAEAGATRVVHGARYEDASEFRRAADVLAGIS